MTEKEVYDTVILWDSSLLFVWNINDAAQSSRNHKNSSGPEDPEKRKSVRDIEEEKVFQI
jgi:hypothetical protein